MAAWPPLLADPSDPDDMARWMREVTEFLTNISIGEPISDDIVLHPNGVAGHILGSFVTHTAIVLADNAYTFTHNLDTPNKAAGGFNVGWVPVRYIHDGDTVDVASTISVNYETGDAITADAIELRFYFGGTRVIAAPHALTATLWFFPTTR